MHIRTEKVILNPFPDLDPSEMKLIKTELEVDTINEKSGGSQPVFLRRGDAIVGPS